MFIFNYAFDVPKTNHLSLAATITAHCPLFHHRIDIYEVHGIFEILGSTELYSSASLLHFCFVVASQEKSIYQKSNSGKQLL